MRTLSPGIGGDTRTPLLLPHSQPVGAELITKTKPGQSAKPLPLQMEYRFCQMRRQYRNWPCHSRMQKPIRRPVQLSLRTSRSIKLALGLIRTPPSKIHFLLHLLPMRPAPGMALCRFLTYTPSTRQEITPRSFLGVLSQVSVCEGQKDRPYSMRIPTSLT